MSAHPSIASRPHYVYRVYGSRGGLLYIGCTINVEARKREHRSWAREWFGKAKRWEVEGPYDYRTARDIEIAAIHAERPRHNRTGRVANYNPYQVSRREQRAFGSSA